MKGRAILNYDKMGIKEKRQLLLSDPSKRYVSYEESKYKINAYFIHSNNIQECYREQMVSFIPMLPLLEEQVRIEEADYILYSHAYARCEDMSHVVIKELKYLDSIRKPGAEIIVVGKAANAEKLLNGSIKNITFWMSHFTEKLGKKFGFDIREQYFVYDEEEDHLAIWPVDGCLQKCYFCRRTYMHIPFESIPLDVIKQNLDYFKNNAPEKMRNISLRAENLTEYGIDIYGKQCLEEIIDLIDSYDEVESLDCPIGVCIGEVTPAIKNSLCKSKKLKAISLNLEAGTDRLLKVIGKKHSIEDAITLYRDLRENNPEIYLSTTVMIGLPTETMADVYALAELITVTQPDSVLCNYYICVPKHPLAKFEQMTESLREYHLKIFLKHIGDTFQRNMFVSHDRIFKNKKSRNVVRMFEELKEFNKHLDFPRYYKFETWYEITE